MSNTERKIALTKRKMRALINAAEFRLADAGHMDGLKVDEIRALREGCDALKQRCADVQDTQEG
jgi:hypothetical protein